jgi:hypothetical protein
MEEDGEGESEREREREREIGKRENINGGRMQIPKQARIRKPPTSMCDRGTAFGQFSDIRRHFKISVIASMLC